MLPNKILPAITVGINNRLHEHELPTGAVRDAVNVDLSKEGHPRRRRGSTLSLGGTSMRSIWTSTTGRCFYADGTKLYEFFGSFSMQRFDGLNPNTSVCYADWPGRGIAFSDGSIIKRIVGNTIRPIALSPTFSPLVATATTGGSLPAGVYQINVQFVDDLGEESGAVTDIRVDVPANGMITMNIPTSSDSTVVSASVYLSDPNGELKFRAATVPVNSGSVTVSVLPGADREQQTNDYRIPLLAGDVLCYFEGCLYSHRGGYVSYTDPYSGQMRPSRNYIPFPEPVTIMHATPTGMFIVADQTYYRTDEMRAVSPARATRGTLVKLPRSEQASWYSTDGIVIASPDGTIAAIQADNVAVGRASVGTSFYREEDGTRTIITSIFDSSQELGADSSYVDAIISNREDRDDSL